MEDIIFSMNPKFKSKLITWNDYQKNIDLLYRKINEDFYPDCIVGIFQGGYMVAQSIGDYFNESRIAAIKVSSHLNIISNTMIYTDELKDEKISSLNNKKIILIDEVVDSGKTLEYCKSVFEKLKPSMLKTASLYTSNQGINIVDYYCESFDEPINYILPWRVRRDMSSLIISIMQDDEMLCIFQIVHRLHESFNINVSREEIMYILKKHSSYFFSISDKWGVR